MNRVLESLRSFQLAHAAALRRASDALGISEAALNAMRSLMAAPGDGIAMKDLATNVGVSRAVLTGIVDRLEDKGWVRRQLSRTDRRSINVVPTVTGSNPVVTVLASLDQPLRAVANEVSDEEAVIVRRLAAKMEGELHKFDPESPPDPQPGRVGSAA